jgi:hypothetical protein
MLIFPPDFYTGTYVYEETFRDRNISLSLYIRWVNGLQSFPGVLKVLFSQRFGQCEIKKRVTVPTFAFMVFHCDTILSTPVHCALLLLGVPEGDPGNALNYPHGS